MPLLTDLQQLFGCILNEKACVYASRDISRIIIAIIKVKKYNGIVSFKPSIVFPQAEEFEEMFNSQLETVKGLQSDLAVASAENQVPGACTIKLYGSVIPAVL